MKHYDAFWRLRKYDVFENIMENTNAAFSIIFSKVFKTFFEALSKNENWCRGLKIAYGRELVSFSSKQLFLIVYIFATLSKNENNDAMTIK